MDTNQILTKLKEATGAELSLIEDAYGAQISLPKEALLEVLKAAKNEPDLAFDCLMSQTGTDMGENIRLTYVLFSYKHHHEVLLVSDVEYGGEVETACEVWGIANWLERETYDLLGVKFKGHPDLRRIMLPEDWEGHPLLKDYKTPSEYNGIDNSPSEITQSFKQT